MNSINIHNIKNIEFGKIVYLDNCNSYSMSITVHHGISYTDDKINTSFEICLFSLKRSTLEQFKISNSD